MKKLYIVTGLVILGILGVNAYLRLAATGIFQQWESLGHPPGGGYEIVGSDGFTVYVRTGTDEIFTCSIFDIFLYWRIYRTVFRFTDYCCHDS